MDANPVFLRIPAELRLQIYSYLLDDGGHRYLAIRNLPQDEYDRLKLQESVSDVDAPHELGDWDREPSSPSSARSRLTRRTYRMTRKTYLMLERSVSRRCFETTYYLATAGTSFHTAIMAVNRQLNAETTHFLYARHAFDFGPDTEAVVPFLQDRCQATLPLVSDIALARPLHTSWGSQSERCDWSNVCKFLATSWSASRAAAANAVVTDVHGTRTSTSDPHSSPISACRDNDSAQPGTDLPRTKLRLTVEGGMPRAPWDGPQELSEADFRLLSLIKHESLDWVADLAQVRGCIQELEVVPDISYCPVPRTSAMIIFAAFSASIEKGLADFLRTQLHVVR